MRFMTVNSPFGEGEERYISEFELHCHGTTRLVFDLWFMLRLEHTGHWEFPNPNNKYFVSGLVVSPDACEDRWYQAAGFCGTTLRNFVNWKERSKVNALFNMGIYGVLFGHFGNNHKQLLKTANRHIHTAVIPNILEVMNEIRREGLTLWQLVQGLGPGESGHPILPRERAKKEVKEVNDPPQRYLEI
jgi:hypothetical protein